MSTQHPITDIHDTEKEAKKSIEDAKKRNDKMVLDAREKEEKALGEFVDGEKEAGKEKIKAAKEEAGKICKDEMENGEREINTTLKEAHLRKDQAIRTASKAFLEHFGVAA